MQKLCRSERKGERKKEKDQERGRERKPKARVPERSRREGAEEEGDFGTRRSLCEGAYEAGGNRGGRKADVTGFDFARQQYRDERLGEKRPRGRGSPEALAWPPPAPLLRGSRARLLLARNATARGSTQRELGHSRRSQRRRRRRWRRCTASAAPMITVQTRYA